MKQYCNITFYVFTQDLQIHCLPKIRAMDLEETWQKNRRVLPACVRQRFVCERCCSFKYPT